MAGASSVMRAKPCRGELRDEIGDSADPREKENHIGPRPEAACLGRVDDQDDIKGEDQKANRHGNLSKFYAVAT